MKKILVTGTAGFIGFHLAKKLLNRNYEVIGLDNINDYYDINLKYGRLSDTGIRGVDIPYNTLQRSDVYPGYSFIKIDLTDKAAIDALFNEHQFDGVINLAAQAGVRYSLINPYAYTESNVTGFLNILEGCRAVNVKHLVYASTSSVYGLNTAMPLNPHEHADHPMTLYAATKKANEMMAHSYSHLFDFPSTGVRFFTVYGPWGRPDMALFLFTKAILNDEPIKVFNNGNMVRDFTYVEDIAEGLVRILEKPAQPFSNWDGDRPDPAHSTAPYRIVNIGNSKPVKLLDYIEALEDALGKKAVKDMLPIQPGDVPATNADVTDLLQDYKYMPGVEVKEGIEKFVEWYLDFYKQK
ncbi:MAG: NAD-dependent epimerase/dehydratase [Chitinophagaceae bacterium]|nr:NAD-dependent epimerase/dehydratase [Chitinophagaceae bacterium]